ncbi:NAD(P)-binding protein [Bacillus sp. NEB1478]|uniref:NAD(P)-binding protein n=1 Tax=Bacillus sp. NEB1478 TaxID=3073816 RepID=UPI002873DB1B|nr:NAD(P)-binding protein [Bacillus sp. NEB1478]WNB93824.1 NAD(P)-binding protein [Bacillus sp. NEB1478]
MYPIHLNLANKLVVIAGGGKIALRKIQGLVETGANITVVSPDAVSEIKELYTQKKLKWISREIEASDYTDAFLIIAATNDHATNAWIASQAVDKQLINVADHPDLGNFIVPSVVRRGKLVFSVSTSGSSPSLSKKIKKELENTYSADYESYVDFLYECRVLVKKLHNGHERRIALEELINRQFLQSEILREHYKQQLINNVSTKIEY